MAASGYGHSAHRYLHIKAVFVSGRHLDHLSAALAGTDFLPATLRDRSSLKMKAKAKPSRRAFDAAAAHSQFYQKEYDHEGSDHFFHPPFA
jgi:hypothetical protein